MWRGLSVGDMVDGDNREDEVQVGRLPLKVGGLRKWEGVARLQLLTRFHYLTIRRRLSLALQIII